jgi:hypothetical protein
MFGRHVGILKELLIDMLTISKVQMEVLSNFVRRSFELYSVNYLKNKYSAETRDRNEEEMLLFVSQGIEKAAEYDIVERKDVIPFLEYRLCYGNDFEINPSYEWASDVFRISNLPGDEIIIRLMENQPLKSAIE